MAEKNILNKYRLAVDLGTSSIGLAVYSLDEQGKIIRLEHIDSYIFGEPIKPKEMVTSNTERRKARLIRRQVERKAARLRKVSYIASSLGISKQVLDENKNEDVIALRAAALYREISLPQLIKVFCHLIKNRGYNGSIKDGTVGKKLKQTDTMLSDGRTLGQLLYDRRNSAGAEPWRKVEEDGTFIFREKIKNEFDLIWEEQAKYHSELNGKYKIGYKNMFPDFPGRDEISLKEAFSSALFYQRPIKWNIEKVGSCEIYPEDKRACVSQRAYQEYRLAKELFNTRIYNVEEGKERSLTPEERLKLFAYIISSFADYDKETGEVPFKKLYEKLNLSDWESFVADRPNSSKKGIKGNLTDYIFYKFKLSEQWYSLAEESKEGVLEFFNNITDFADIKDNENEYIEKSFYDMTKNLRLSDTAGKKALEFIFTLKPTDIFSDDKFKFESGRASYGINALKSITSALLEGNEEEYGVVAALKVVDDSVKGKLRSPQSIQRQESLTDPVICKALNEFHRVMAYVCGKYGNPSEVIIELSRDIKNSLAKRQFLESQNKKSSDERNKAIKFLQENSIYVNQRNIERYLLWEEQNHLCPYSGRQIKIGDAFNEKETQVDHIVPQCGEIGGPNVFENKVLVFTNENKDKGNSLPYDWKFKQDIDDYKAFLKSIKGKKKGDDAETSFGSHSPLINFVQRLWLLYVKEKKGFYSQKTHKWKPTQKGVRILRKIENLLMTKDQLKKDFSARQNQETAWIGKIVMGWCKDVCPKVTPSYGALTSYLRSALRFDRVLPSVRIDEGKALFNKDEEEINSEKWKELFPSDEENLSYLQTKNLKEDFEKYLSVVEDKPNTEQDKEKLFKRFCTEQRALFQFDKRCDHRHHAVDAAVIGLCDLSMIQRAARHNSKNGTLQTIKYKNKEGVRIREKDIAGFTVEDIPQYDKIRTALKKSLMNYIVWHKPDHFPSGALFKDTAYNIKPENKTEEQNKGNAKERLIVHTMLKDLLKDKPESTIKNIDFLVYGETIKKEIIYQFKERLLKGMTQEEALCGKKGENNDGIIYRGKKVFKVKKKHTSGSSLRSYVKDVDKKITSKDKNGNEHIKYYENGGYACMDFEEKSGKFISIIPLWRYKKEVPQGVIRIFAGDTIFNKQDKNFYKVQSFKASHGMQFLSTTEANKNKKFLASKNFKDFILIKTRADIAKIKKEYV